MTGIWERRPRGRLLQITVEAVQELSGRQRGQLEAAAAKIGAFLGAEASLATGVLQ